MLRFHCHALFIVDQLMTDFVAQKNLSARLISLILATFINRVGEFDDCHKPIRATYLTATFLSVLKRHTPEFKQP